MMVERKTDEPSSVMKALSGSKSEPELSREIARVLEKEQAIIEAKQVIYSAIRGWTGKYVKEGGPIPIVRNGRVVETLPSTSLGRDLVDGIARASEIRSKAELKARDELLTKTAAAAEAIIHRLNELTILEAVSLNFGPINRDAKFKPPLEDRIIREIGYVRSAFIACSALKANAETAQKDTREELNKGRSGAGRPRNEAAYGVALGLAKLYARVTGRRPTYSEDPNGVSGEFTPVLRDVFDRLGWNDVALSGPAEAAKAKITNKDLDHEIISQPNRILWLSDS